MALDDCEKGDAVFMQYSRASLTRAWPEIFNCAQLKLIKELKPTLRVGRQSWGWLKGTTFKFYFTVLKFKYAAVRFCDDF